VELDISMLLIELYNFFQSTDPRSGQGLEIAVESVLDLLLYHKLISTFGEMSRIE